MIEVLEPQDRLVRQFVDSAYVLRKGTGRLEFTAYPGINTPVGLFRDAAIHANAGGVSIESSDAPNYFAMACNQFSSHIHLQYVQLVDEIAINFKPLGFASFSGSKPQPEKLHCFGGWNKSLPSLFSDVFGTDSPEQQLQHIETFLLERYSPVAEEPVLLRTLDLLNDTSTEQRMQDIANTVGMHYKQLYRLFRKNVGCSMAQYRNLVKFRRSVASKITGGNQARLVDVCYDNGYTDQPYFIKQFKQLTGEKPGRFFKQVVSFGKNKVIFKMA